MITEEDAMIETDTKIPNEDNGRDNLLNGQLEAGGEYQEEVSCTASLEAEPPSAFHSQPRTAGNTTGSAAGAISEVAKRPSGGSEPSKNSKGSSSRNKNPDESLKQYRFRYSTNGCDEEEWERSDMDFSTQSSVGATSTRELTAQQIHDQRVKLSRNASAGSTSRHQPTPPPPVSHQLSFSSYKGRRNSSNTSMVPGAFSVDGSNMSDEANSVSFGDDPSSMMDAPITELEVTDMMQLEAVPVDDSADQARMNEMEEQMQREIERRLSLERKVAVSELKTSNKRWMPIAMALLVILSAIATGLYFWLVPNGTQDVESFFIYPPPTDKECLAVENGDVVPKQDTYYELQMAMTCDISYNAEEVETIGLLLAEIAEAYEKTILPALVGCLDEDGYFNDTSSFTENRYLVANAQLLSVKRSKMDCSSAEPSPCIRVTVNFLAWTEVETSFIDMFQLVETNFGPKLLRGLKWDGAIHKYTLVSLGPSQHGDHSNMQYPPPTAVECEAVLNGDAVPNQDQYPTSVIDITLDVSFTDSLDQPFTAVTPEVGNKLRSSMAMLLVGCNSYGQEVYNHTLPETQYIIADVAILDLTRSNTGCHPSNPQPCVQWEARLFLWLRRPYDVFDLVSFVHSSYQSVLVESIQANDIMQKVTLVSADAAPVQFEFPPPTDQQCEAIVNGNPVAGRDKYDIQLADSVLDVSTHQAWEDLVIEDVLLEVRRTWQTLVLPSLTGCMDQSDETWKNSTKTPERYAIFDASLLNVTHVPGECAEGLPRPCIRVGLRTQVWLRKEFDFSNLTNLLDQNYGPALMAQVDDLVGTSAFIKQVEMVSLRSVL